MATIVTTYPTEAEWLKARLDGITSSDAPIILGVSPYRNTSPLQLYATKLGLMEPDASESEAMYWGKELEPIVAKRYELETGRALQDPGRWAIQVHRDREWMLATVDREIVEIDSYGILEIKTTGAHLADRWDDEPPLHVQVQLQHQLAVTGCSWGSIACLIGGQKFVWADVKRNPRFISLLIEREEEFRYRLQKLDPPPATADSLSALAVLYPKDTGEIVELPEAAVEWDRCYREALDTIKNAEGARDEAKALLQAALGDASVGRLPGGGGYSWKQSTGTRKAAEAYTYTYRALRRIK